MTKPMPTATNTSCLPAETELPQFRFPPFPQLPEGVTIMPFKDFKPRGIQLFVQLKEGGAGDDVDDVELDGMGIPTVELHAKHATDECKSNRRKKHKKKKASAAPGAPVKKLPWYEEWEEGEDLRVAKGVYDPSIAPTDRLFQAGIDFRSGRPWPPVTSGLNSIWDQFRLYIGLLVNPSVHRKDGDKSGDCGASPDSDFEDDDEHFMPTVDMKAKGSSETSKKRPRPRDSSSSAVENGDDDEDEPFDDHNIDEDSREEKLTAFLNDPEQSVRIFLSSHMREKGLIWSERNLTFAPHLLSFFIRFLIRNRVLPEQRYQRGLKRALETIEQGKRELPLTFKIGHLVPDKFSEGCMEVFGRKGNVNWTCITIAAEEKPNDASGEELKLTVTDISTGAQQEISLPTEEQTSLKEAIEDNLDVDVDITKVDLLQNNTGWTGWGSVDSAGEPNGWGSGWGEWNAGDGQNAPWSTVIDDQPADGVDPNVAAGSWGDSAPTWNRDVPSLMTFLGPSVFSLTHTTGIVECSTRRVREVHPPAQSSQTSSSGKKNSKRKRTEGSEAWAPSANGVEAELDALFAKVVLAPWGVECGDISKPEIWSTSRGLVVDPNATSNSNEQDAVGSEGKQKPHNPLTDDITLLVEPRLVDSFGLVPGLGLGAMWVQLVRQDEPAAGSTSANSKTFWYHEDVTGIFPSFYTPGKQE